MRGVGWFGGIRFDFGKDPARSKAGQFVELPALVMQAVLVDQRCYVSCLMGRRRPARFVAVTARWWGRTYVEGECHLDVGARSAEVDCGSRWGGSIVVVPPRGGSWDADWGLGQPVQGAV